MKSSSLASLAITSFLAIALQGCAHSALETRVDNEVAQESRIKTSSDLRAESAHLIQSAPNLTLDQRSKLTNLRAATEIQIDLARAQSLKLRSVLMKDLISTHYDADEVALIKQKMRDLENKRLSVTFNAVEEANTIMGHGLIENRTRMMDGFFEGHNGGD